MAQRWSPDGRTLFFSREPFGLGGYILFAGASPLYRLSVADKLVTEVIPLDLKAAHFVCLDALSADGHRVADDCADKVMTVRDLTTGLSTTIQAPADVRGRSKRTSTTCPES